MATIAKPGKAFLWTLTVGVVVVLVGISGYVYRQAKSEQVELLAEISSAQQTIASLRDTDTTALEEQITDLEARDRAAETLIAGLERRLRDYTHTIEIDEALFNAAEETNVTITSIRTAPSEAKEIDGVLYRVLVMSVGAEAAVPPELINFSIKATEELSCAYLDVVDMTVPEPPEEGDESEGKAAVELRLTVYYLD